ncbi:MAG: GNAT family N-acetyltransferase [Dichotomicrobium sp.]
MAFLRSPPIPENGPQIEWEGLLLRMPRLGDYHAWAELRAMSREHLEPWEPAWTPDELSRGAYRMRLKHYMREMRENSGYAFFMFKADDNTLLGGATLSNIRRGVSQSCSIGYWVGAPYAGQGVMTKGVRAIAAFVFDSLYLHRLEAACLPTNVASIRVLEKVGFTREGLAREYLKINGRWQDHFLYALLKDDTRR